MNTQTSYQQKLVSVEDAAKVIRSGDRVGYSPISSAPVDVINAICRRKDELENVSLYTALALYLFDYFGADYRGRISHTTLFMGPFERMMMGQGNIEVISCQFAHAEWILRNVVMPRVFIAEVSPPDEHGNMSYGIGGTAIGHTTAEMAKTVIVQINR
jgi:4-hydroxybutyrate CoA-transferase